MNTNELDQQKVKAFAGRMMGILNDGGLALMSSIGYRTKLFDTMAQIPPATSTQIAEAAGLHERYVREWLNAMVVGRVVEYDPQMETYRLPAEHAALLTRAAGGRNLALYAQHLSGLGSVENQIVDCFFNGGGVPYSAFPRFHEVMAESNCVNIVEPLPEQILPLVPGLAEKLNEGIDVLDVGCGHGHALTRLAQIFPRSRFVGLDFVEQAIVVGQTEAEQMGLTNLRFIVQDAATFDQVTQYDLITAFDAIHDQAHPAVVLRNIYRALKPNGTFLMQDIAGSSHVHQNVDHPLAPFLYTISTMHCMTVSLAYGGDGLGTMWGKEKALEMLADAGFSHTAVHELPPSITSYFYVSSKVS